MIRRIDAQSYSTSREVQACTSALLVMELLRPGRALYLCAPEIVNSPILANDLLQFAALMPHIASPQIRLETILQTLNERGVAIRLIVPPTPRNGAPLFPRNWQWAEVRYSDPLYMHGMMTDNAYLRGDLRFTHSGVTAWAGILELLTNGDAALPRKDIERQWQELA